MLSPIPVDAIFALGQTGWDNEMLLLTGINRINDVENLSFDIAPAAGDVDSELQLRRDVENFRRFRRVIELLVGLAKEEVIELQRVEVEDESSLPQLVFDREIPEDYRPLVDELKNLLDLENGRDVFRVTTRLTRRKPDEITIQSRSLLAIMSFLAKGVEVPDVHLAEGWVGSYLTPEGDESDALIPVRIRSRPERPASAFAAVRYQGHWFYVDQADLQSKAMFQMLLALFELQAPAGGTAAPLLTLPTGG